MAVHVAFRFHQANLQKLTGVVPLVDRVVYVEAFVALEADQVGLQAGSQGPGDLGLADSCLSFEEEGPLQLEGQKYGDGQSAVGYVGLLAQRVPIPLTFILVVAATVFLIVFFGAWAVSADADGRDKTLAFGFVGGGGLNANNPNASQLSGLEASGLEEGNLSDAGDSWWGQAFLKACPFH